MTAKIRGLFGRKIFANAVVRRLLPSFCATALQCRKFKVVTQCDPLVQRRHNAVSGRIENVFITKELEF
jgi:hypothetical protein